MTDGLKHPSKGSVLTQDEYEEEDGDTKKGELQD